MDRNIGQNNSTEIHLLEIYQAGTRQANGFQTEAIAVTLENMKATWLPGNHGYGSVLYTNLDNIAIKIQTESSIIVKNSNSISLLGWSSRIWDFIHKYHMAVSGVTFTGNKETKKL